MKVIETVIYVMPTPKGRAKVTAFGGHAQMYTPAKTVKAENEIAYAIRQQCMGHGVFDVGVPLAVTAIFYVPKPKSASKKVTMPTHKPDLDNYLKLLLDALNKFVIPDDSQVVSIISGKRFSDTPRIELKISEVLE
ncbi:MAG: RusA family crossover junction endodeoxyribonuclease [Dehalococcoidia bacterium]|jgi:Holliday junction resolvase RusA-like endonuclease